MGAGTIVLVGCGQMGSAMLRGWLKSGAAAAYHVVEPMGVPEALAASPGVHVYRSAAALSGGLTADAVVFAIKPQIADEIVPDYRRFARAETVFMSIAAGKTIAGLARHLGATAAIVRVMPNTPAAIGRAISVACANPRVGAAQRALCDGLLAAIGESTWVDDEALMDAVTAVSGSGPAYVFLLIETLAAAGEKAGLPAALALRLARDTVAGSGELARQSGDSPARLREAVTSPGGTTRAALDVLMGEAGIAELMDKAVAAATRRSRELAS
jgi:pyrroline-5-carboxylate reductase